MQREYSDKMAELCRQEEEAKKQVGTIQLLAVRSRFFPSRTLQITTWEQMYTDWMSTMEKRVSSLQVTNQEMNVRL